MYLEDELGRKADERELLRSSCTCGLKAIQEDIRQHEGDLQRNKSFLSK